MSPLSQAQFEWLGVIATFGLGLGWGARDVMLLRRNWARRAEARDLIYGSIMGLVMITIGIAGILLHLAGR